MISGFTNVDKNEDADASKLHEVQQLSTPSPHLVEKEFVENRAFPTHAGNCLGRRGSGVRIAPPRPIKSIVLEIKVYEASGARKPPESLRES